MSELTDALERIFTWIREHKPTDVDRFQPGLSLEEIREKLSQFPCQLPREIYTLYQWHNGTIDDSWECGVFVYHSFMDVDRALQQAEEYINEKSQRSYREQEGFPLYLFPFCDFEGEYFAVSGVDLETDSTPVFFISEIGEIALAFSSLTNMMSALAECYETGIYVVKDNGFVEVVEEVKFGEIRLKHNPGTVKKLYASGW
jgi:hypothetical protein